MPRDQVDVALSLRNSRRFVSDAQKSGRAVRGIGKDASFAAARAKALSKSTNTLRGGFSLFGSVARTAASGAAIGMGLVGAEIVRATKGWSDHMDVVRRTNAVVKSTGGAANVTARQVGNLSDALERKTGMDGDAIQSGANMLLTFTNLRNEAGKGNDVFNQATGTLIGMSQAMGSDPKQAAIQLGKALNDPVKGMNALSRVGVTFDDQQAKTIKSLVKSGKTMEAQKIILAELNKEFPKVKATPFQRMMVAVHGVEDAIGKAFLPVANQAFTQVAKLLDDIQPTVERLGDSISKTWGRKDLDFGEKLKASWQTIKTQLGPIFDQAVRTGVGAFNRNQPALNAALDRFIKAAAPTIGAAFAFAGPRAAKAFIASFKSHPGWTTLITLGFLQKRFGLVTLFTSLAGTAASTFCGGFKGKAGPCIKGGNWAGIGTAIGRFMGPAAAVALAAYLEVELAKAIQKWTGKPGEKPTNVKVPGTDVKVPVQSTQNTQGRSLTSDVVGRIFGGKHKPVTDPGPSRRGGPLGPAPIAPLIVPPSRKGVAPLSAEVVVPFNVDGRELTKAVIRVGSNAKARK